MQKPSKAISSALDLIILTLNKTTPIISKKVLGDAEFMQTLIAQKNMEKLKTVQTTLVNEIKNYNVYMTSFNLLIGVSHMLHGKIKPEDLRMALDTIKLHIVPINTAVEFFSNLYGAALDDVPKTLNKLIKSLDAVKIGGVDEELVMREQIRASKISEYNDLRENISRFAKARGGKDLEKDSKVCKIVIGASTVVGNYLTKERQRSAVMKLQRWKKDPSTIITELWGTATTPGMFPTLDFNKNQNENNQRDNKTNNNIDSTIKALTDLYNRDDYEILMAKHLGLDSNLERQMHQADEYLQRVLAYYASHVKKYLDIKPQIKQDGGAIREFKDAYLDIKFTDDKVLETRLTNWLETLNAILAALHKADLDIAKKRNTEIKPGYRTQVKERIHKMIEELQTPIRVGKKANALKQLVVGDKMETVRKLAKLLIEQELLSESKLEKQYNDKAIKLGALISNESPLDELIRIGYTKPCIMHEL